MGIPQILMIVMMAVSGTMYVLKHGEQKEPYNFWDWLAAVFIECGLLYWGGFF